MARWFGLPRAVEAAGGRRYGFHGLSHESIAGRLAQLSPVLARGRAIAVRLGSGASLCALHEGRSIATTMGFSALDGLVMADSCGSLDPGVLLCLSRQGHGFTDIEDMLHHRSGLLVVSGISGDIGELLASAAGAPCISRPDSAVELRVIETDEESRGRATHEGDDPTDVRIG